MKKITTIFVLAILIVMLASCSKDIPLSTEDGELLVNNELLNFYFYYPSDWFINKNEAEISIFKNEESLEKSNIGEEGKEREFLVKPNLSATALGLTTEEYGIDGEAYWQNYCLPVLKATFPDLEVLSMEDVAIAGLTAKRYDYTMTVTGMAMKYAQVFIIDRGAVYTLTYTASPAVFDENLNALESAIETFTFK